MVKCKSLANGSSMLALIAAWTTVRRCRLKLDYPRVVQVYPRLSPCDAG
jgi:hypothetical protein